MEASCEHHWKIIGVLWEHHGSIMGAKWEHHGSNMEASQKYHHFSVIRRETQTPLQNILIYLNRGRLYFQKLFPNSRPQFNMNQIELLSMVVLYVWQNGLSNGVSHQMSRAQLYNCQRSNIVVSVLVHQVTCHLHCGEDYLVFKKEQTRYRQ